MLMLVLILVVIALALVLAGLFLHVVALAWASVGISLLASVVLVYDWWQTRTAVRAGRQQGGARDAGGDQRSARPGAEGPAGAGPNGYGNEYGGADMEPATQVLPVVPPVNAAEETVVMPVVAPSGSAEAPSGASRSGGLSSPDVTSATADESVTTRAAEGGTTAVDPAAGPEPGGGGDPATGIAPSGDARPGQPWVKGSDATGAALTPDPAEAASTAGPTGDAPSGATQATSDGSGSTVSGAAGATVVGGAAAAGDASYRQPDDATTHVGRDTVDEPASAVAAGGGAPPNDDRTRAAERLEPSGEAPEEPRDPAHASLVARLPDEVVVIDEHPRYHVQGCPSLPGQPLIPLPVSEAVDLGFTPCGWCTPNRVLSERHPAEAR